MKSNNKFNRAKSSATITIEEIIRDSANKLNKVTENPRLEAEILLSYHLNKDKVWLYTHLKTPVLCNSLHKFSTLLTRRLNGEPISYILGYKEFWKDKFLVNRHTLIPRPETEIIVEHAINWCKKNGIKEPIILDLGTGSGNIALSILKEFKNAYAYCLDISFYALKVAKENAKRLGLDKRSYFFVSNWLSSIKPRAFFDIIVTNPPYISSQDICKIDKTVRKFEPESALFARENGLSEIKNILNALHSYIKSPMLFISEIGYNQKDSVIKFINTTDNLKAFNFNLEILKDLAGLDRAIKIEFC